MKNELRHKFASTSKLTVQILQKLQAEGFQYVQVKGFNHDKRLDYFSPTYLLLVPIKAMPADIMDKEIYEPLDSRLLSEWARLPNEGIEVFIASL